MRLTVGNYAQDANNCIDVICNDEHHIMCPSKLDQCSGFVLLTSSKTAVGVGVETGHGVLIRRLGEDERGRAIFSAPVPLETTRVGVGLSIGWEKLYTIMLLNSQWVMSKMANGVVVEGLDGEVQGFARGDLNTGATKTHRSVKLGAPLDNDLVDCPVGGNVADVYAATSGFMLADISFSGGRIAPSFDMLKAFYGEGVTVHDVLSGKVSEPPHEFDQVYKFLNTLELVMHTTKVHAD